MNEINLDDSWQSTENQVPTRHEDPTWKRWRRIDLLFHSKRHSERRSSGQSMILSYYSPSTQKRYRALVSPPKRYHDPTVGVCCRDIQGQYVRRVLLRYTATTESTVRYVRNRNSTRRNVPGTKSFVGLWSRDGLSTNYMEKAKLQKWIEDKSRPLAISSLDEIGNWCIRE